MDFLDHLHVLMTLVLSVLVIVQSGKIRELKNRLEERGHRSGAKDDE